MARRRPEREQPDAYERAASRIDADRRSRELGDPIPALPPGLATPLPDRRKMRRTLYILGTVLLVLIVGRLTARSRAPEVAASCTTLRIVLQPAAVRSGGAVSWSATGPSGQQVAVTVGGKRVSRPGTALSDCRASGKFVVPALAPGNYDLTLQAGSRSTRARLTITG